MPGKPHVDIPSIGDAVLKPALVLFDQFETNHDSYISTEPIFFVSLTTQHHQHFITIC
jgi:hypothetical protein